jgi:predicted metal-dependent phosphoesterase TrpH
VLKVELHSHTSDDPLDRIPHSTADLIDRAAVLGYDALAVTLHEKQLDAHRWQAYAQSRGVLLIPGIEQTIEGKHVLLLNFSERSEEVRTFADLAELKRAEAGLVVAPHAFFPNSSCLGASLMDRYADLFDAVEYNAMFTRGVNFNRAAERWAGAHRKPMVGNGDVHRLQQLGSTFSLIDAPCDVSSICDAIRSGKVRVEARPLPWTTTAALAAELLVIDTVRDTLARYRPEPDVDRRLSQPTIRAGSTPRRPSPATR